MRSQLLIFTLALTAALGAQQPKPVGDPDKKPAPPITGPQGIPPGSGSEWFERLQQKLELGDGERQAVGVFPFRNPHDATIEWRDFTASCACSHLEFVVGDRRYWLRPKPRELVQLTATAGGGEDTRVPVEFIPVHAGESGEVQVHVNMSGQSHKKSILVDIQMTDETAPMVRLLLDIEGVDPLVMTPPEVDLGVLAPDEQGEFTVEVHAPGVKDFDLRIGTEPPPGLRAELSKAVSNGFTVWTVRGTYGPIKSGKGGGGIIKLVSDIKNADALTLRVMARVAPPIELTPGFLSMGPISAAAGKRASVRFHATDGTDLQAVKVEFANLSKSASKVESQVKKDGKDLIVEIVVPEGTPSGLLRGDLVVELNHGKDPSQRVLFNGYVR